MLLPEDRLETLVGQLRTMRTADRRAILRRLQPAHRDRVTRLLVARAPAASAQGYSEPLIARIDEALGKRDATNPLTSAAYQSLLAASGHAAAPSPSLANAIGGLLNPRAR